MGFKGSKVQILSSRPEIQNEVGRLGENLTGLLFGNISWRLAGVGGYYLTKRVVQGNTSPPRGTPHARKDPGRRNPREAPTQDPTKTH